MKMTSATGRPSPPEHPCPRGQGGWSREPFGPGPPFAFTLLELVVALTLVAIITAVAIPTITGLTARRAARVPMQTLEEMAQEARSRAMQEGRPYQLLLTNEKIIAARFSTPYETVRQLEESLIILEKNAPLNEDIPEKTNTEATRTAGQAWHRLYALPEGLTISTRFWDEEQARDVSVDEPCRWVFQPSGLCRPVSISLKVNPVVFTATFDAMTAEITKEVSDGL